MVKERLNPLEVLNVSADGWLTAGENRYRCALGRSGPTGDKREGDGATPIGEYPLRRVFYRADRLAAPATGLETVAIGPEDGWCDAPDDPRYNRLVTLPHATSHERMWRNDHLYDLVVVLGHNDDPPVPGLGSAIFMHVAKKNGDGPGFAPTEGCVALAMNDLLAVLARCGPGTRIRIQG